MAYRNPVIAGSTIDRAEVDRFSRLAHEWWNPAGKFKPLHKFNPVRLAYIRDQVCSRAGRDKNRPRPFEGLRLLDIGCGGGLLCEPMARLGAGRGGRGRVGHQHQGREAPRRAVGPGDRLPRHHGRSARGGEGESFDVVLNMEVVEHVADVDLFMEATASMVRPEGLMFVATINRTAKGAGARHLHGRARARLASQGHPRIREAGAPRGARRAAWNARTCASSTSVGVAYNLFQDCWEPVADMDVNYMVLAQRPGKTAHG